MTNVKPAQLPHDRVRFTDLAIYDDVLPSPASPFRTLEYEHYLSFFRSSVIVSLEAWHFGFAHGGMGDFKAQLPIQEELKDRILSLDEASEIVPRLAYVTFLGNAARLLTYFEKRRIPFILQLYPGGSYEPDVEGSDAELRKIVKSPLCRRIIATQTVTKKHLTERIGCDPDKIVFIYGGVFNSRVDFSFDRDKKILGRDKETIDICFVAHRYSENLSQKGYDQFVAIARKLAQDSRYRFHVVGGHTSEDLPLGEAVSRTTFYGAMPSTFFDEFYARMDIILSPNNPPGLGHGAFDGFPTGACMEAGFRGVVNCVTDPLRLNVAFEDGRDIIIIDRDVDRTVKRLQALTAVPERLYALARATEASFRRTFDIGVQLRQRTSIIVEEMLRGDQLILRPSAPISALDKSEVQAARAAADHAAQAVERLIVDNRHLASLIEESNRYGETRHDNLYLEYKKLVADYERLIADNQHLATLIEESKRYGETRHDNLYLEYKKVVADNEQLSSLINETNTAINTTSLIDHHQREVALVGEAARPTPASRNFLDKLLRFPWRVVRYVTRRFKILIRL